MINFDQFKKFDRVRFLDPNEQQRQYWMFRNNALNPILRSGGGGAGGTSPIRRNILITQPADFSFFTVPNQQFITTAGDFTIKTSTGYAKVFYPYDILVGPFGNGDPNTPFSIILDNGTFWNGILPFKVLSCDVDGNNIGDVTYIKFDNLIGLKSLDLTNTKDTIEEVDLGGCTDLEQLIIPSSVSLQTLNISNTKVSQLNLQNCEFLQFLDISSTTFGAVYTLDLSGANSLINISGNNCNLFGLITSSLLLEEISLNDANGLSLMICNNFTGNSGVGIIRIKNCSMGPGALDDLYTSLGNANGTNNIIYVYGNPGILSSNPSIATDKGYTIDINP